jgi:hypothetical protein
VFGRKLCLNSWLCRRSFKFWACFDDAKFFWPGIQAQATTPQAVVPQQQQQQAAGVVGKSVQAVGPKGATSWKQRLLAAGFLAAAGACTGVVTKVEHLFLPSAALPVAISD